MLERVRENGDALMTCTNQAFRNDKEIVMVAVRTGRDALLWASDRLRKDGDVILEAVAHNGRALRYAYAFRDSKEIVLQACKVDGNALQFASSELRSDVKVASTAVEQTPYALQYCGKNIQNSYDIVLKAVEQDGMTIRCASRDLQGNFDVGMAACKNNPAALKYLDNNIQQKVAATLSRNLYEFDHVEKAEEPKALDSFLAYFDIVELSQGR